MAYPTNNNNIINPFDTPEEQPSHPHSVHEPSRPPDLAKNEDLLSYFESSSALSSSNPQKQQLSSLPPPPIILPPRSSHHPPPLPPPSFPTEISTTSPTSSFTKTKTNFRVALAESTLPIDEESPPATEYQDSQSYDEASPSRRLVHDRVSSSSSANEEDGIIASPTMGGSNDDNNTNNNNNNKSYLSLNYNGKDGIQIIHLPEDVQATIYAYQLIPWRETLVRIGIFFTLGILFLLLRWFPRLRMRLTMVPCSLRHATHIYIINEWKQEAVEVVKREVFSGTMSDVFGNDGVNGLLDDEYRLSGDSFFGEEANLRLSKDNDKSRPIQKLQFFTHRYTKYVYNPYTKTYTPLLKWIDPLLQKTAGQYSSAILQSGLETPTVANRLLLFGGNIIDIPSPSTLKLLLDEVLHPFYIFQVCSIILWCIDEYFAYAACIAIISITSAVSTLIETKRNLKRLREMSRFECDAKVFRNGEWTRVKSSDIVPGDIIEINPSLSQVLPADAALLSGDVIVNEAMLTGESVPVSKIPITQDVWHKLAVEGDLMKHKNIHRHVLFSGTKLIRSHMPKVHHQEEPATTNTNTNTKPFIDIVSSETEAEVEDIPSPTSLTSPISHKPMKMMSHHMPIAVVLRSGFMTTRGNLTLSMLFPKPHEFHFYRDSYRFIAVLFCVAICGFCATVYYLVRNGTPPGQVFIRALDLITIVVPPGLPAAMSVGTGFALSRLRKGQIYCISPPRVNVAGKVEVWCFDKTGTLTEEGLNVRGIRVASQKRFDEIVYESDTFRHDMKSGRSSFTKQFNNLEFSKLMEYALATCHSVKIVEGECVGDPMDLKILDWTRWSIEEGGQVVQRACPEIRRDSISPISPSPKLSSGFPNSSSPSPSLPSFAPASVTAGVVSTILRPPGQRRMNFADLITKSASSSSEYLELGVLKVFEFVSELRRMSVVVRELKLPSTEPISSNNEMFLFTKGAPESLLPLVDPSSVPVDIHELLSEYTHSGYRVIAVAYKSLKQYSYAKVMKMSRDECESGLTLLGLAVFENKLKPGTKAVIGKLRTAKIKTVMCTGDNILTAISVSRECGLINPNSRVFIPRIVSVPKLDHNGLVVKPRSHKIDVETDFSDTDVALLNGNNKSMDGGDTNNHVEKQVVWESADGSGYVLDPETLKPYYHRGSMSNLASSAASFDEDYMDGLKNVNVMSKFGKPSVKPANSNSVQDFSALSSPDGNKTSPNGHMIPFTGSEYDLAITGEAFDTILEQEPEILARVLFKSSIYARMSPEQKHLLVEKVQENLGYTVGFCGDGANDCGALKAADVGLSLSEAEASVAAPFTSRDTDLGCVLRMVREGRAALVTSFSCFKYMALYSLIQFTSVTMLYSLGKNLGDGQFLYVDLFLIMPVAVFMGQSGPYTEIHKKRPTATLMSRKVLTSMFGQVLIQVGIQIWVFLWIQSQSLPPVPTNSIVRCYENTVLFLVSSFQYVLVAIAFTVGPPYRESMYKNVPFVTTVLILTLFTVIVTLTPPQFLFNYLELVELTTYQKWYCLAICAVNLVLSLFCEKLVFTPLSGLIKKVFKNGNDRNRKKWKLVEDSMKK